jgi:hypothetical protein
MPKVVNQDPSGRIEPGGLLSVLEASSENEAILAAENFLRLHKQEDLEISVSGGEENNTYQIKLR